MIRLPNNSILKYQNSDFKVSEVSLLNSDCTTNPTGMLFTLVTLAKEGYTTFEVIDILATFLQAPRSDIHSQGLKDEDGITEQLISLPVILESTRLEQFNNTYKAMEKGWLKITQASYSSQPVKEKSLHGNIFNLKIRNLPESDAVKIARKYGNSGDFIFLNYYDQQRFGLPNGPFVAHKIGEAIVDERWDLAEELYLSSGNKELDAPDTALNDGLYINLVDNRKLNFFLGAYTSYVWNKKLSDLMAYRPFEIFPGCTVSSLNIDRATPTLVHADAFSISDDSKISKRLKHRAAFTATTVYVTDIDDDEYFTGKKAVTVQFLLPTGSYATMLVKQLIYALMN